MSPEFLRQLTNLFDGETPEKYIAYQNLKNNEVHIHNEWKRRLSIALKAHFNDERLEDNGGWKMKIWDNNPFETTWYLAGYRHESVSVYMWNEYIRFWAGAEFQNGEELKRRISTVQYSPLILEGLGVDECIGRDAFEKGERGQWQFGSPFDNQFYHVNDLLWYAGNRTEDYVQQIAAKLDRFMKNPRLVSLLRELNEEMIAIHEKSLQTAVG